MDIIRLIKLIFLLVFACAGSFFVFMSMREGLKPYRLMKNGVETEGVVTEMYRRPTRSLEKTSGSYAPVVKFMTHGGQMVTYYSTTFSGFNDFAVGQKVRLWYLKDNPHVATMEGMDSWILGAAFGVFGVAICLVFYPMLIKFIVVSVKKRN